MGPVLNGLIELQRVENRLRAVKNKLVRCRRSVVFQENQVRSLQNNLEAKKEEIKLTKIQVDRLELELKDRDQNVAKYSAALNMAKSNKEYSAILTELNTAKADNSKIENQILDLMKNIEADQTQSAEIQKQIDEQKAELEKHRKEVEEKAIELEKQVEQVQIEWDKVAREIPKEVLDIFQRVADTYDGEAIASIEQQDQKRASYSCGGCFMGLTAETVNKLMTKDDVIRCPTCTRILVLKDDIS